MVGNKSSHRNSQFLTKNTKEIVFVSIFLLGFILRVLFINSREIAYDDSFSYFLARQSFSEIIKGTAADTMPPLYYFLLHIWMQISNELWFLRLLNVMINLSYLSCSRIENVRNFAVWSIRVFLCYFSID